jgi:hypothetical protein
MSMYPTEQRYLALEPSVMSLYPIGHPNLAKDPLVMPHYMSVLHIIRPKKPFMDPVSLFVPKMSLTPSVMSQYLSMSPKSLMASSERSMCFSVLLMVS